MQNPRASNAEHFPDIYSVKAKSIGCKSSAGQQKETGVAKSAVLSMLSGKQ